MKNFPLRRFWQQLGPGLTTGAADDDPAGVATYSQTGSQFGLQFLWTPLFSFPLMAVVQEMCARIGLVTGRGLAANIRLHFSRRVLWSSSGLLFAANTFNIAADLAAMAAAVQLLFPTASAGLTMVLLAGLMVVMQVFLPYRATARVLKWLALVLLAYVATAFLIEDVPWGEVLRNTLTPTLLFSREGIILLCAILGTTISPYLFFWQTSQEVEEEILQGEKTLRQRQRSVTPGVLKRMRWDVYTGMFFSNAVMFFIILTSGVVLNRAGITTITTAAEAAKSLEPLAGPWSTILFAIGIIGVGLLAIPVLAGSAAYALCESLRWREGLYRRLRDAWAFYAVLTAAIVLGLGLNFFGLDPIKALIYSALFNGLVAPLVLALIVRLASNRQVMGRHTNSFGVTLIGWIVTALMTAVAVATLIALG